MQLQITGTLVVPGMQKGNQQPQVQQIWLSLEFFSNVWQLVLKQRPWLVLLYCSMQQAFKGHFGLCAQLLAPACGVRESTVMAPSLHMTQQQCPATMAIWLSLQRHFPPSFFPHPLRLSLQNYKQSLPQNSSPILMLQLPATKHSGGLVKPCTKYIGPWHSLSMWLTLHLNCHRSAASSSS